MQAKNDRATGPTNAALKMAESARARARARAQVRYRFVERERLDDPVPPLARMLRGGRGGQVRLKLYLSYLWLQREENGTPLGAPARAWATMFDLPDPQGGGARRITEAQTWLEEQGFLSVSARPGQANIVVPLDDAGTVTPYVVPGVAAQREREKEGRSQVHKYIQIPSTFWTRGHIALLSGAGVAMLLALLCERGSDDSDKALWFSPSDAERRFALSEDTRTKGLRELASAGLVTTKRRPVNPTDFEVLRMRNVHVLDLDRLNEVASLAPRDTDKDPFKGPAKARLTARTKQD